MDELQCIATGGMGLVVCDIFCHICPSKVKAYNSKFDIGAIFVNQFASNITWTSY